MFKRIKKWFEERKREKLIKLMYKISLEAAEDYRRAMAEKHGEMGEVERIY